LDIPFVTQNHERLTIPVSIAILVAAIVPLLSTLVRTILLQTIRHPLTKTQIEIHDDGKKQITVKTA
jgi:hypothetical protein